MSALADKPSRAKIQLCPLCAISDLAVSPRTFTAPTFVALMCQRRSMFEKLRGGFDSGQMTLFSSDRNPNVSLH